MAFARAMDYSIDKDEFWQLSSASGSTGTGTSSMAEEQQRFPSDFFDQFVVMEEGAGADFARKPSGESFFLPLQGDQQGPGGDGISSLTSSVTAENLTSTFPNTDPVALSYTTSNLPTVDGPAQLASLTTTHKKHRPATQVQAAGRDGISDATPHVVLGQLNPETLEQRRRLLSGRRGQIQQPASGSISDSELLQLEGLSVNSPRRIVAPQGPASSTSPSIQAFGPTTTGNVAGLANDIALSSMSENQQKPKSGTRRFETIYSTIRRAVGGHSRGRAQQHHPNSAPIPQTVIPSHMESAKKATRRLASESQSLPTGWQGLPISPPLTDMVNTRSNDTVPFVNGFLDDPFFDPSVPFQHAGGLAPAAQISGKRVIYNGAIPHTPSRTPNIKAEHSSGEDISQFYPATNEPWDLNATFPTTSDLTSNVLSFDGANLDTWTFDPSSDSGSNLDFSTSLPETSSRNHHNLTIQVPPYVQDHRHSGPGTDDLATNGLMIHMPQPQTPSTAPLLSSHVHPMHESPTYPFPDQQQHPQSMHSFRGVYTDHGGQQQQQQQQHTGSRRPKPRAPSSGARYHHHMGPASAKATTTTTTVISPRKTRPQSCCPSSSPSPTPGSGGGSGGGGGGGHRRRSRSATRRAASLHRASTGDINLHSSSSGGGGITAPTTDAQSHAIRKRRSTSSWLSSTGGGGGPGGGQRRTMSVSSASAAAAAAADCMMSPGGGGGGGNGEGGGGGGGGGQIGFVNYTPSDHSVLMTGVAPSGSSKTKARREKEAMERQRKLSEAVRKAVTAAGVDVGRLKEEGIVI